jgi:hypothetical protein
MEKRKKKESNPLPFPKQKPSDPKAKSLVKVFDVFPVKLDMVTVPVVLPVN